ncbi:MAG: YbhB/YbcL family Raf kinase inhibitor-like protein [Deltaproteobacteria bacterium]|nr:YbhB/YbcL family Raf kinase inhibitor-like protein [Deltaproteobacteria bacterium]
MPFTLTSVAFKEGTSIPMKYTGEGPDISPELQWDNPPARTVSFALIMDDPDAPPGTWVHWVLYNLPAETRSLEENIPKVERLPSGAKQGLCWGVDSFDRIGYHGPLPPPGKPHRYYFKLYALEKMLTELPEEPTKFDIEQAMQGSILAEAKLMGTYQR